MEYYAKYQKNQQQQLEQSYNRDLKENIRESQEIDQIWKRFMKNRIES